jgi:hypothetical protein
MANVYVANGTYQAMIFQYRIPERDNARALRIPPHGQAKFPEDLEGHNLEYVLAQLHRYGARPHDDIRAIINPKALVYRVDRAVTSDAIDAAAEKDEHIRQDISAEKFENAGLQAFNEAKKTLPNPKALKKTVMEIEQLKTADSQSEPDRQGVDFEVEVSVNEAGKRATKRRG